MSNRVSKSVEVAKAVAIAMGPEHMLPAYRWHRDICPIKMWGDEVWLLVLRYRDYWLLQ